jgi:hypothetical protein
MSYSITKSEDEKYIILKAVGNIDRHLSTQYYLEAHALGAELGINRYLIDFTQCRNTDTILRNYKFAFMDMQNPGIDKTARTAMLVDPNDHTYDFIETLLVNSGIDVSLFRDKELAIWYLLHHE